MADSLPEADLPGRSPWRLLFHAATQAVFLIGANSRLRYGNPAFEQLIGQPMAELRGLKVSRRRSATRLGQALAPPPEARNGGPVQVRRPPATQENGPPWWDVTFLPLADGNGKRLAVLGLISVTGVASPGKRTANYHDPSPIEARLADRYSIDLFAGESAGAELLVQRARLAAETDQPTWIIGETGVGKQTYARVIHQLSRHVGKPFLTIEPVGLQPYLIDSLLFGKGGVLTNRQVGSLYVPEPGRLPRELQLKLMSAVAPARPDGPRLICGSRHAAAKLVADGALLREAAGQWAVLELTVPPLAQRVEELPKLVSQLWQRVGEPEQPLRIDDEVWLTFSHYSWPGNLSELGGVLRQASQRADGQPIGTAHLPRKLQSAQLAASLPPHAPQGEAWTLDSALAAVERRLIQLALHKANGSQTEAAAALDIFRNRLIRRMEALGLRQSNNESGKS